VYPPLYMKKKMCRLVLSASLIVSSAVLSIPSAVFAHSGGTDSAGCHAGSQPYHCHSGSSYKPYQAPSYNYSPTPTYKPYQAPSYRYSPTPTYKPYQAPSYRYSPTPTYKPYRAPAAAFGRPTAICGDYTLSYSRYRSGACSGHRGVLVWGG
jgi:hypothetical protein